MVSNPRYMQISDFKNSVTGDKTIMDEIVQIINEHGKFTAIKNALGIVTIVENKEKDIVTIENKEKGSD